MLSFFYQARSSNGELVQGTVNVESEQQAVEELTAKGLYIVSLKNTRDESSALNKTIKLKLKDVARFTARLAELVSSGLPLLKALDLLEKQFSNKPFGNVVREVRTKIRDGSSFSEALSDFKSLPPLLSALLESGEASGNLDLSLREAANIFEKELDLRNKVKSTMFYPVLVLIIGFFTIFFLLAFVIPKIAKIFSDLGQSLPFITQLVLGLSNIFKQFWWGFIILGFGGYWIFKKYTKFGKGKLYWEEFKLKLPLLSKIWLERELVLFCRTLGMLVRAGVPLIKAVDLTKSVLGSEKYRIKMQDLEESIKQGNPLSKGVESFLPQDVVDIITVGEETGNLENSLLKLAENYEKDMDYTLKITTQLLEPLMILFVGAVVGVIIIAVLLPIFQLNMLIK